MSSSLKAKLLCIHTLLCIFEACWDYCYGSLIEEDYYNLFLLLEDGSLFARTRSGKRDS